MEITVAIINPIPLVPPVIKAIRPLTENKLLMEVETILIAYIEGSYTLEVASSLFGCGSLESYVIGK